MKDSRPMRWFVALMLPFFLWPSVASGATEQLPDLTARRLTDISTKTNGSGQRQLRFSSVVGNLGSGPFQVTGSRSSASETEMTSITQQIFNDEGDISGSVSTGATMFFAGDGHSHWHVRDLETFELVRTDNGVLNGTGEKHGFCFYDIVKVNLSLPNAPQNPLYTNCGGSSDLQVEMGLSIGWGDRYHYSVPDQYIDITGLISGRYRMIYRVDVPNWFVEENEGNNKSCVTLQIRNKSVSVIDYSCTS